ncbi:hypothetical protein N9R40_02130, partial [bacterium]|nr:hypothetical protein [bacterium]
MEKNKIALILWFSFLFTAPVSAQMMIEQEADALFESLSNWGRWGENDQKGTVNFITSETRVSAARLVQTGTS